MFVLCCLEDLGYKCSVEHNAGLFRIELLFYLYTACFGPFSGHNQACHLKKNCDCKQGPRLILSCYIFFCEVFVLTCLMRPEREPKRVANMKKDAIRF